MADLSVAVYGRSARSQVQAPPSDGNLSQMVSEALHVVEVLSVLRRAPGDLMFTASPDHADVTDYTARLRISGNATIVDTLPLGVPTPDAFGNILADLTALYSGQAAGDYTVSVLTTTATGSADSEESNAFTLPLA